MRPSRYDDPDYCKRHGIGEPDFYKGQRPPVYGLIMAALNLYSGEHSLLRRSEVGTFRFVRYLAYQVPCAFAVPVGLALLLR